MGRRPSMLAVLVLAALLLLPVGWAGTYSDPEIEDGEGDATVTGGPIGENLAPMLDLTRGWFVRDGPDLDIHLEVAGSEDISFADVGTTVNGTWHAAFVSDGDWRVTLDWVGTPARPNITAHRNGSLFPANITETHSGRNISVTWENAVEDLGEEAILTDVHAFTMADQSNDANCFEREVVDCAPNASDGFGREFQMAGPAADLTITPDPPSQQILTGETGVFDVTVANDGDESHDVALSSEAPEGWNTSFVPAEISVAAGGSESVSFNVEVPGSASPGAANVTIVASVGDTSRTQLVVVDVVEPEPKDNPYSITAPNASKTTQPGKAVGYDVLVTNQGSESDKYSIHVDEGQKSWVSFSSPQVELDPGQSAVISVQIKPAAATGVGTYEHLIGVHPLSNPSKTKTVTLTTTVEEGGGDDGGGDGFSLEDLFGTGQGRTVALAALGAVALLIVIVALVVLKRRRDRRFYGEEDADDDDHIYRP